MTFNVNANGTSGGGSSLPINTGIVPHAGGGQTLATQLDYGYSFIQIPASSGNSVALPAAVAGSICILVELEGGSSTNVLAIFAKNGSTDTINGNVSGTQYDFLELVGTTTISAVAIFACIVDGAWVTNASGD